MARMKLGRLHPKVVHTNIVSNQSSRHGARPSILVLHSTEGSNIPNSARDLVGLGSFFDQPATDASSHIAVDSDEQTARYVRDAQKAWTQAFYNPVSLSIEIIGRAAVESSWTPGTYREVARWLAEWSLETGIPLRRAITIGGGVQRSGVASHKQLGAAGGGHVDPGTFKVGKAIRLARRYKRARLRARR